MQDGVQDESLHPERCSGRHRMLRPSLLALGEDGRNVQHRRRTGIPSTQSRRFIEINRDDFEVSSARGDEM